MSTSVSAEKATKNFKEVIKTFLDKQGENDPVFKEKLSNKNKSIDECIGYIFACVKKSGCQGFADDEIFGMALHYYDEEEMDLPTLKKNINVVVNHVVELTAEEIEQEREKARKAVFKEQYNKTKGSGMKKRKPTLDEKAKEESKVLTLF